ncbi:GNAT family N-acetyltransferase [Caulifigura coniformis]|nr:GNAT family N-acetyltransferase [Caulifigura coniformis]
MKIRPYEPSDWRRLCEIHDPARRDELRAFGQPEAFVPLEQAAGNEGLFDSDLFVAEIDGGVEGFVGLKSDEVTWLYVSPARYREGIGRALLRHAIAASGPETRIEVLEGNAAALALYLSEGFVIRERAEGKLVGNESFTGAGFRMVHRKVAPGGEA